MSVKSTPPKTLIPRKVQRYGWKPDLPCSQDKRYSALPRKAVAIPPRYDLREKFTLPDCYDQGELGSCTGNGCGFAWWFALMREGQTAPMPSRLFIYYGERVIEGTVNEDSGAQIRDGFKVLNKWGCCDEALWPYKVSKFTARPPLAVYREAAKRQAIQYFRVNQKLDEMKRCLAEGFPIVFGFTVYESFEGATVAKTGVVKLPGPKDTVVGGHCVAMVGYDEAKKVFICRNSWGTDWGQKGYFTLPYAYALDPNLADDFWSLRMVEED